MNYNPNISYFNFLSSKFYNGLEMLIVQAKRANELITGVVRNCDIDIIKKDIDRKWDKKLVKTFKLLNLHFFLSFFVCKVNIIIYLCCEILKHQYN